MGKIEKKANKHYLPNVWVPFTQDEILMWRDKTCFTNHPGG